MYMVRMCLRYIQRTLLWIAVAIIVVYAHLPHLHSSLFYTTPHALHTGASVPGTPAMGYHQWNGHYSGGEAGDWCADILKHGMDRIGNVLLVLNPSPNPEPRTGTHKEHPTHTTMKYMYTTQHLLT